MRVPLKYCGHAFQPGHRVRLSVSTSYWPLAWAPPKPVRLTVWPAESSLTLPVRRPLAGEDERVHVYAEPESARTPAREIIEPDHDNWWIVHDLATEESTLEVVADEGTWRIPRIDLTMSQHTWEWYRSTGDDFTSPNGEVKSVREMWRGDWHVRIENRTFLTCDEKNFYVNASLDAWEGENRVYSRIFNETIPRHFL